MSGFQCKQLADVLDEMSPRARRQDGQGQHQDVPAAPAAVAQAPQQGHDFPMQGVPRDYRQGMSNPYVPAMPDGPWVQSSQVTPGLSLGDSVGSTDSTMLHNSMPHNAMPHNAMPSTIIPDNVMPDNIMPYNAMPHDTMPNALDSYMNSFNCVQSLPDVPMLTDDYGFNNYQQFSFDSQRTTPEDAENSGLSRVHSCEGMTGSLTGFSDPASMQMQMPFQHASTPYQLAPPPENNADQDVQLRYARRSSAPELHMPIRTNADLAKRHAKRRASHNIVEKRYRTNLNLKFQELERTIRSGRPLFEALQTTPLSDLPPNLMEKVHVVLNYDTDETKDTTLNIGAEEQNGRAYTAPKAAIIDSAMSYIKFLEKDDLLLRIKLAQYEDSAVPPAADSRQLDDDSSQPHHEPNGAIIDKKEDVQDGNEEIKTEP